LRRFASVASFLRGSCVRGGASILQKKRYTQYVEFVTLSLVNVPMVGSYPLPVSALRLVLYEDAPPCPTDLPPKLPPLPPSPPPRPGPVPEVHARAARVPEPEPEPEVPLAVGARRALAGKAKVRVGASKASAKVGDVAAGKVRVRAVCSLFFF
jgi:hypothetical protein